MKKTDILVITTEFPPGPGGIGQHAWSLSLALSNKGYNVHVLAPNDNASTAEIHDYDNSIPFKISRTIRTTAIKTYIRRITNTLAIIHKENPKSIILTGKFSLWQGLVIRIFFSKKKIISFLHGTELLLQNNLLRGITLASIINCNHIIAVSNFTKSLLPKWIASNRRVQVIPNGINIEELIQYPLTLIPLQGKPSLLTVGQITPRKGQHRVISALPYLRSQFPDMHYHMVGKPVGSHLEELRQLARKLDVEQYITIHPPVNKHSDLSKYYHNADIFLLLSENQPNGDVEGFGIVAIEANYFGLPVIGAKGCGIEDAVSDKKSGLLIDGSNPILLADAIRYCQSNKVMISREGKLWAAKHDWESIINLLIKLL